LFDDEIGVPEIGDVAEVKGLVAVRDGARTADETRGFEAEVACTKQGEGGSGGGLSGSSLARN
jgi:hypothetical protein